MRAVEDKPEKSLLARVAASAGRWALVLGVVGFVCGFFGPIALSPEANQGPLLGIFISGPGGALLGAILGAAAGLLPLPKRVKAAALAVVAIAVALVTLYYSTPSPQYRATIVDAEFRDCQLPDTLREATLADWDERIAKVTWAEPRAGWREDFDRMLQEHRGVVITLDVRRSTMVYENRKPWNKGTLILRPWQPVGAQKHYFACAGEPAARTMLGSRAGCLSRPARHRRNGRRSCSPICWTCRPSSRCRASTARWS